MYKFIKIHNILLWVIFVDIQIDFFWSFSISYKSNYLISNICHYVSLDVLPVFLIIFWRNLVNNFMSWTRTRTDFLIQLILMFYVLLFSNIFLTYFLLIIHHVWRKYFIIFISIVYIMLYCIWLRKFHILWDKINMLWSHKIKINKIIIRVIYDWLYHIKVDRKVRGSRNCKFLWRIHNKL
jgi:hypothetical protein